MINEELAKRQRAIERLHRERECSKEQLHAQSVMEGSIEPKMEVHASRGLNSNWCSAG